MRILKREFHKKIVQVIGHVHLDKRAHSTEASRHRSYRFLLRWDDEIFHRSQIYNHRRNERIRL